MDEGKVLLIDLAKGRLGEDAANVLGSLSIATIALAAMSRASEPRSARRPFFLYVDEFQTFTTLAFATMMPELRKYGVGLTLAHQHLFQLSEPVRHAVLGNVGTLLTFRVGAEDVLGLSREIGPPFEPEDLVGLSNHSFIIRLMIDGHPARPFTARTIV